VVPCVARVWVPWPRARRIGVWVAGSILGAQSVLILAAFGPVDVTLGVLLVALAGLLGYRARRRHVRAEPDGKLSTGNS
jgi:hypothetical protein